MIVNISVPRYTGKSWRGVPFEGDMESFSWRTDVHHCAVRAGIESYCRIVNVSGGSNISCPPRIGEWTIPTAGVGFVLPKNQTQLNVTTKNWIESNGEIHPPIIGIGGGPIDETGSADIHQLGFTVSFLSRFPSVFVHLSSVQSFNVRT